MKKTLILICLACLTLPVLAQKKVFSFGLKGGLNNSWLSDKYPTNTHRNTFHAGALVHLRLSAHWRLQPEIYFSAQGEKPDKGGKYFNQEHNYLVFPVIVQYRFLHQQRFYVEAGPQIGALVNGRNPISFEVESEIPYRDNNEVNTFDVMMAVGTGYQFTRHVTVYTRMNIGVTTVRSTFVGHNTPARDYNEVLQLGVSYLF